MLFYFHFCVILFVLIFVLLIFLGSVDYKIEKLMAVRYGDLIIPSEAEIKESEREIERVKATTIHVPQDTFISDISKLCNSKDLSDVCCF
jgi:hypothetical protein